MVDESPLRVAVIGAAGRMGVQVLRALGSDRRFQVVTAIDREHVGTDCRTLAGLEAPALQISERVGASLDESTPQVAIDFTAPSGAAEHAMSCLKRKVSPVVGTSGLSPADLSAIRDACAEFETPAMVVPNFAIGALLMMRFAEMAAAWLPDVEIVEAHSLAKLDAPSGTALHTAEKIKSARQSRPQTAHSAEKVAGARGANVSDVHVHSIRLPGVVAHQQVVFGGDGEVLTIRHDSLDRQSFMLGVKVALREVRSLQGLTIGLEKILFRG